MSFYIGPCDPAEAEKLALAILDLPEFQAAGGGGVGVARVDDDGVLCDTFAPAEIGAKCEALAGQPSRHEGVPSHGERVAEHTSTLTEPGYSSQSFGRRPALAGPAALAHCDGSMYLAAKSSAEAPGSVSVLCSTIHNEEAARMSHGWGARATSGGL